MLSIIIPTLNEEKIIGQTIAGLKALTLPHEIIVSDGKSTDRTVDLARAAGARVLTYELEKRQKIAEGRNAGALAATGDFFVFLDADCTIPNPDQFFQRALANFERDKQLVAVTGALFVLPANATLADKFFSQMINYLFRFKNNVLKIGGASGEFQMMRRAAFEQVHGFREDLVAGEDDNMFFRLAKIGRTLSDPALVLWHTGRRIHKVGWPRLLSIWFLDTLSIAFRNKSASKEWKPIR